MSQSHTKLFKLSPVSSASLRRQWREVFDSAAPRYASNIFLENNIIYQRQAQKYGGLSFVTEKRLIALLRHSEKKTNADAYRLGTKVVRLWQGKAHEVTVVQDGFLYDGNVHSSLSAIARLITGTRWNGPLFFGLKKGKKYGG